MPELRAAAADHHGLRGSVFLVLAVTAFGCSSLVRMEAEKTRVVCELILGVKHNQLDPHGSLARVCKPYHAVPPLNGDGPLVANFYLEPDFVANEWSKRVARFPRSVINEVIVAEGENTVVNRIADLIDNCDAKLIEATQLHLVQTDFGKLWLKAPKYLHVHGRIDFSDDARVEMGRLESFSSTMTGTVYANFDEAQSNCFFNFAGEEYRVSLKASDVIKHLLPPGAPLKIPRDGFFTLYQEVRSTFQRDGRDVQVPFSVALVYDLTDFSDPPRRNDGTVDAAHINRGEVFLFARTGGIKNGSEAICPIAVAHFNNESEPSEIHTTQRPCSEGRHAPPG